MPPDDFLHAKPLLAAPGYMLHIPGVITTSGALPACAYVTEDGITFYVAEDGTTVYRPEICPGDASDFYGAGFYKAQFWSSKFWNRTSVPVISNYYGAQFWKGQYFDAKFWNRRAPPVTNTNYYGAQFWRSQFFNSKFWDRKGVGFVVTGISLSGSTVFTQVMNAGAVVGAVTVTTSPPISYPGQVMLGGPDAALFALTNGGFLPTNLVIGGAAVGPGSYNITLTAI